MRERARAPAGRGAGTEAAPRPRLPRGVQLGYAATEAGTNLVETLLRLYLLIHQTDVVGLQPGLAGLALGLGLVWDAFADPVMGAISDRTLHRFGGRRVWLPIGSAVLAVGLLAVFWPPELASQAARFGWLLGTFCLLNTGFTVLGVPYQAMAAELTDQPDERATLIGWRFAFANLGALGAAALPFVCLPGAGSAVSTMRPVSAIAAGLVVATALVGWWATRGVPSPAAPAPSGPLLGAFVEPLRNRAFRPLLGIYVTATLGIGINSATFAYYYEYHLRLDGAATQTVLGVFLVVFTVSILGWVAIARRFGRRRPVACGALALGFGTATLYSTIPPGDVLPPLVGGAVGLGSLVGCIALIDSLLTDVVDHDTVHSRRSRAGMFFGTWRFAGKLARAAAIGATASVLEASGFRPHGAQSPEADRALVLLFGPAVGLCFVAAAAMLFGYRFDEHQQARVRRILRRRAAR